ncbi:signal peptidase II [Mesoplasma photuris]|uniref:signal peptidase II n=1 Tax=Mesoplasma photuris TaxID=217731 RepID=UPI00068AE86E|nr:signal peptidase II [Mesoplasma photuris]
MWLNIKEKFISHEYGWKWKLRVALPLLIFLIAIDWIIKAVVVGQMEYGQSISNWIPGVIGLDYIINPGAAKGVGADNMSLTISLASFSTLIALIGWIFIADKKWNLALTFILAGSFANLLARSWAPMIPLDAVENAGVKGGVVDMFKWEFDIFGSNSYVFNLADLWVNIGIAVLILAFIIEIWNLCWKVYFKTKWENQTIENLKTHTGIAIIFGVVGSALSISMTVMMFINGISYILFAWCLGILMIWICVAYILKIRHHDLIKNKKGENDEKTN